MADDSPKPNHAALREVLFRRMAQTNRDLIQTLADLAIPIAEGDEGTIAAILPDIDNRLHAMSRYVSVLEEFGP